MSKSMVGPKDAAAFALKHLFDLLGTGELAGVAPEDVRLEEIEYAEDTNSWKSTFSYPDLEPAKSKGTAEPTNLDRYLKLFGSSPRRRYKVINLSADDGELLSMKLP